MRLDQRLSGPKVGNLEQDLGLDGFDELIAFPNRNHERALASDDAVLVIDVEVRDVEVAGLAQHDRQAVDRDPFGDRGVAGFLHAPSLVVGTVAGHVDHLPGCAQKPLASRQFHAEIDGAGDRGPLRPAQRASRRSCPRRPSALGIVEDRPGHDHLLVRGARPFHIGHGDPAEHAAADGVVDGSETGRPAAKPSRCRACSSVSMEKEMSTATTRARSTSVSGRACRRARSGPQRLVLRPDG